MSNKKINNQFHKIKQPHFLKKENDQFKSLNLSVQYPVGDPGDFFCMIWAWKRNTTLLYASFKMSIPNTKH